MRDEVHLGNYRTLMRAVQVDPDQWMAGPRCYGWEFEFWSVSMRAAGGVVEERLAAVSVLDRVVWGQREWIEAFTAVASGIEACATVGAGDGRLISVEGSPLRVRASAEWAAECPDGFDAFAADAAWSSLGARITVTHDGDEFCLDDGQLALFGTLGGIDTTDGSAVAVEVAAAPIGPLAEVDEALGDYARWDFAVLDDPEELWEIAVELGRLVDRFCPIPAAAAVPARWQHSDVAVHRTDTDLDSLIQIAHTVGRDRVWWCRWCPEMPLGAFAVGNPIDGVACCEAHIAQAVDFEQRSIERGVAHRGDRWREAPS